MRIGYLSLNIIRLCFTMISTIAERPVIFARPPIKINKKTPHQSKIDGAVKDTILNSVS